ncbi:unnamed protein product [Closterium sp. NIES-64]|nr:unnamed protein product [Closterium sp. NIES-64]
MHHCSPSMELHLPTASSNHPLHRLTQKPAVRLQPPPHLPQPAAKMRRRRIDPLDVLRQLGAQSGSEFDGFKSWTASGAPAKCSKYYGVTCDAEGKIVAIHVPSARLVGPIDALSSLEQLYRLELSYNNGVEVLPQSFTKLKKLKLISFPFSLPSFPPARLAPSSPLSSLPLALLFLLLLPPLPPGSAHSNVHGCGQCERLFYQGAHSGLPQPAHCPHIPVSQRTMPCHTTPGLF